MKFNPTNYPVAIPVPADTLLLWQASTDRIRSARVSAVANAASPLQILTSVASMAEIDTEGLADGAFVVVTGYYAEGDGGGGDFYYDADSSATANGGTIIAPDVGDGRWIRVYSGPINIRWFGALGDGTGNDGEFIQNAADFLAPTGGEIYFPTGRYRSTVSISLPVTGQIITFSGDSYHTSIIVSAIPPASTALLRGDGTISDRCYFVARDLALEGNGAAGVHGIYLHYGTPFSELSDLLITGFIDGIRLANIYRMSISSVQSILNVNGIVAGLDIAGADAVCNAISFFGGRYTNNTARGMYLYGCRNMNICGGDVENNGTDGLLAQFVFGITVTSVYSETSLISQNTVADFHFLSCRGVSMSGVNISNWYTGKILVKINDTQAVTISGFNTDLGFSSVATRPGIAVDITDSQGVVLNACQFTNIANGVRVVTNGRVMINYCYFSYCTVPLFMPNQAASNAIWNSAYGVDLAASSIGAACRYIATLQEGTTARQNWTG